MKHAYLIMAHNNFYNLRKLIEALDDESNDIYIHINKRVHDFNQEEWTFIAQKSQVIFVERIKVEYCEYSQLLAVLMLLSTATREYHDYYHLMSGSDLPIKSNEIINDFFCTNRGKEFIGFAKYYNTENICQKNYLVKYHRYTNKYIAFAANKMRRFLIQVQKIFGYNIATRYTGTIKKGCDWYSVTHAAAEYLILQEPQFRRLFEKSFCPTEFFAQTLLYNSDFRQNIYCLDNENTGSQRYIDWERGTPYVFKKEDQERIEKSPMMFARKFSDIEDRKIIDAICDFVKHKNDVI